MLRHTHALAELSDVAAMVEDIEQELGLPAAWDASAERADRSWSRRTAIERTDPTSETVRLVEQEIDAARSIRRSPFTETGAAVQILLCVGRERIGVPLGGSTIEPTAGSRWT